MVTPKIDGSDQLASYISKKRMKFGDDCLQNNDMLVAKKPAKKQWVMLAWQIHFWLNRSHAKRVIYTVLNLLNNNSIRKKKKMA